MNKTLDLITHLIHLTCFYAVDDFHEWFVKRWRNERIQAFLFDIAEFFLIRIQNMERA